MTYGRRASFILLAKLEDDEEWTTFTTEESPSSEYVQDSYTNILGDIDNTFSGEQGGAKAQNQPEYPRQENERTGTV